MVKDIILADSDGRELGAILDSNITVDTNGDPQIRSDLSWKNLIGQASGESYAYEWSGNEPVCVLLQPCERSGGIRVGID